jgi:hypothetical protein
MLDAGMEPVRMSAYSYEILKEINFDEIRNARKQNAEKLIDILLSANIKVLQKKTGLSDLFVAFFIDNREERQNELSQIGVFNTIIWPLSKKQKEICKVAKYTEQNMLAAPCDQRYQTEDMEYVGNMIVDNIRQRRFM